MPLQIGTNLAGISDWSTQYPFMDYLKNSRSWITRGETVWGTNEESKLNVDSNGWVKSLSGGSFTSVATFIPNDNQGRRFVVLYEGEGTIEYNFGLKKDMAASSPGRDVVYATPGESLYLGITKTDPNGTGNYIRNMHVIPEQYESTYTSQLFNPDFLNSLKGYETLRFMDQMVTNNSTQKEWSDRPKPGDFSYYSKGVPVEVMVELANQTGIDPWFNIPHQATDEYVRNFSQYVKTHLDPKLKVYVEYSNETWNYQFQQAHYALKQAEQAFPDPQIGIYDKQRLWFGQRTGQITQIWDEVYGAEKDRVVGVLATQAASSYTATKSLEALTQNGMTPKEWGIDAVAIAPYFGLVPNSTESAAQVESWTREADGGLNKLFQELSEGGVMQGGPPGGALQEASQFNKAYSQLAQAQGLDLIAYEGGQHLVGASGIENNQAITDLFIAANRDPRMGQLYAKYLQQWGLDGGGVFAHYTDVSNPNKWGSWGAKESLYQPNSPKAQVIRDLLIDPVSGISPQANPDLSTILGGQPVQIDVLANDIISDDVTLKIFTQPSKGTVEVLNNGTPANLKDDFISYTPNANASDKDEFTYQLINSKGTSSTAAVQLTITPPPPSTNSTLRLEAESLELQGYQMEQNEGSGASGGQQVSLKNTGYTEGSIAGQFTGAAGAYQVVVGYYDENDGQSSATVTAGGQSMQFTFDQDLPSDWTTPQSLTTRTVLQQVDLKLGDRFKIAAKMNQSEFARFDYIEFVPVSLAASFTDSLSGLGENGVLTGDQKNDVLLGSDDDDILIGDLGNDDLDGNGGNDIIYTGEGVDKSEGGEGNDFIDGGSGNDDLFGEQENGKPLLKTAGNDIIYGGIGDDNIFGDGATVGDVGSDDILNGGSGSDNLTGGKGRDYFMYENLPNGDVDNIFDFSSAEADEIVLNKFIFTSLNGEIGSRLGITDFAVVSSNSDVDKNAAIIVYNSSNGNLFYNPDGSGIGGSQQFAELINKALLSGKDFRIDG
jgi:Ca2+-binding RTX toxin-like protein